MSKFTYTNTFTKQSGEYDPETDGSFAVAFKAGDSRELADGRSLFLAFGNLSTPQRTLEAAVADFALIVAEYPELRDRIGIYIIPCVYSTRDGWIEIEFLVPAAIQESAAGIARSNWSGSREAYKRKNKMSSFYF